MSDCVRKVLHIAPTPFFSDRGCHVRIRGIVSSLDARGFGSLVCTYPIGRDVEGVKTIRCRSVPGYKKTEAGPSAYKLPADLFLLGTVMRTMRSYRPDVLHCHLHEGVLIGWLAKLLLFRPGLPVVFDMQGSLSGELDAHGFFAGRGFLRRAFRWLERRIVGMADVSVCSSEVSARQLLDEFGIATSRVFIARDGADVDPGRVSHVEFPAAGVDIRTAIYSGGLSEGKGLGVLEQVLLEASRRQWPARFIIVGYPTERLAAFVAEHGLEHICILTGQVPFENLASYLACATLALEPKSGKSGEASGKLVNYMAAGLPVVCFDTPNNRDMLAGNGIFASDGNVGAFVERVEYAIYNQHDADTIGSAAKERAESVFSWSSAAEQIIRAYATLGVGYSDGPVESINEECL